MKVQTKCYLIRLSFIRTENYDSFAATSFAGGEGSLACFSGSSTASVFTGASVSTTNDKQYKMQI